MANDIYPYNAEFWELDASVRTSVHPWTKALPVDVTLTTPGTAQDLVAISATNRPTVNLITNPSFETGAPPTGYTTAGAAFAQSAVIARTGTNSGRITPDNLALGEGVYWTSIAVAAATDRQLFLVASAYFNDNAGSGNNARVVIADSAGATLVNGTTVIFGATWVRSSAALRLSGRAGAQYRIYFVTSTQHGTVFYEDSAQLELLEQNTPTDYCDGAQGMYYEWDGTAHASVSRRRLSLVAIRGYRLHTTRDIYFSEDHTASSTTGEFIRAGTDFEVNFPIHVRRNLSFVNVIAGEQPRVYGRVYGPHLGLAT